MSGVSRSRAGTQDPSRSAVPLVPEIAYVLATRIAPVTPGPSSSANEPNRRVCNSSSTTESALTTGHCRPDRSRRVQRQRAARPASDGPDPASGLARSGDLRRSDSSVVYPNCRCHEYCGRRLVPRAGGTRSPRCRKMPTSIRSCDSSHSATRLRRCSAAVRSA